MKGIDWPWVKLSVVESLRKDEELQRAQRHTTYATLRHIDTRVARFLHEPFGVQRATLLLLQRDRITHEAGNRGVASTVLVTGLANVTSAITAVVAVILAAYFGFADQLAPEDAAFNQNFLAVSLLWVVGGLAVVLLAVGGVWLEGIQRDRRRAAATLWHQIFTEAHKSASTARPLSEDDAIRAWLQRKSPAE